MTPTVLAALLAAIALAAAARQAWTSRRRGDPAWRMFALVAGQAALAASLYFFLQPPARPAGDGILVVLTADAPRPRLGATAVVATPEAPDHPGVPRVPDLATALRARPDVQALRVVGAGLVARDRDAIGAHADGRGVRVVFEPTVLPAGVVALDAPTHVAAGRRFVVTGRVHGVDDARLELLDPAGRRVDLQPASEGGFALSAIAGPAGRAAWTLRRRDAADAVAETVALPIDVHAGAPLRVLALAGGVNPEQKYLARWALDAGLAMQARASAGGGVDIGATMPALTADGLRGIDLVILDDRAWRGLGDGGRAALREAVRDGVGVLLRLSADPGPDDRAILRAWGFDVATADVSRSVELPHTAQADTVGPAGGESAGNDDTAGVGAAVDASADARAPVPLSRRALAITAADGAPLLRDAAGEVLAVWRAEGRGRVAVWNLADTFRLQLAGRHAAYGDLWADAIGRLARAPDGAAAMWLPGGRVGERMVLCGLGDDAVLRGPDDAALPLRVDPASGDRRCAAAWPTQAGWYTLLDGERTATTPVRARDEALGVARAEQRAATQALAARGTTPAAAGRPPTVPGARWPGLLAFLAVAALLWLLEKRNRA